MARITRKELKTDKFALEVEQTVDFFEEHRQEVLRYGAVALAIAVIVVAVFIYRGHQHTIRQEALAQAIRVQEAPVGANQTNAPITFPTEPEKQKASIKAFTDLATKYSGSDEAIIAENYLGAIAADAGKLDEAEKRFKMVIDSGNKRYGSIAKLSLAQLYFAQNRNKEAEALLRSLMANPTELVSKEQATFALARGLASSNPEEARKLLEPLRTSHNSTVSQQAITLYAELSAK